MSEDKSYQRIDKAGRKSLSRLMGIKDAGERLWEPDDLQAILQHQLSAPVNFDLAPFDPGQGPPVTAERSRELAAQGLMPQNFNELLHHPNPPLDLLNMTKEYAKDCRNQPEGPLPPEVASVLYYASIVVARIRCQTRITNLEDHSLRTGLQSVLGKPWVDEATRSLLSEGVRVLDGPGPGAPGSEKTDG